MTDEDYAFLDAMAAGVRKRNGVTGHRKTHCVAVLVDTFLTLEDLAVCLPARLRTEVELRSLVLKFLERRIDTLARSPKPLHAVDGLLLTAVIHDSEFQSRLLRAVKQAQSV